MGLVRRLRVWFSEGLWETRTRDLPPLRRIPVKLLKITLLSTNTFQKQQDITQAAALTLYTLMSVVPVTALFFGIAKGFGLDANLEGWLLDHFKDQKEVIHQTVSLARQALDDTQGSLVAGAGILFLIYTALLVINNIEAAFNRTWSVARSRPLGRKLTDYLSLILVGPFIILGASSLNVYVATIFARAAEVAPVSKVAAPAVSLALRAAPLLLIWLLFTFIYVFIPNTKVKVPSALFGGALAAFLFQMLQTLYIGLQVGVSKNNAIYGSFAALPFFIIWLQFSWGIVLMGAVVTHQHQNFEANEREEHLPELSFRAIKRLALRICDYASMRFMEEKPPATAERMTEDLGIPSALLRSLLDRLVRARLLVEVVLEDPTDPGYNPARDPHGLTPAAIVEILENQGEDLAEIPAGPGGEDYGGMLQEFDRAAERSPLNRPLSRVERQSGGREKGRWI